MVYSKKDADLAQRILKPEYLSQDFMSYMIDYNALNQPAIPASNVPGINAAMVPIGVPLMWLNTDVPSGYVLLDGANVSRTTYVLLFQIWGTAFGTGDGSTTFGLPNFTGAFGPTDGATVYFITRYLTSATPQPVTQLDQPTAPSSFPPPASNTDL